MLELYNEHKGTIRAVAYGLAKNTGCSGDDLEAEGNLIFSECAAKYDSQKGKFGHYLKKSLNWGLYSYARKRTEQKTELNRDGFGNEVHRDKICEITFEDMSRDARTIVDFIFKCNDKTFEGKKICKKHIFKHFKNQGWKNKQIKQSFRELTILVDSYAA